MATYDIGIYCIYKKYERHRWFLPLADNLLNPLLNHALLIVSSQKQERSVCSETTDIGVE